MLIVDLSLNRYYIISSAWIRSWKKFIKNADTIKKPPSFCFQNREIRSKDEIDSGTDFYLIPDGELLGKFKEHFCWETIAEYVPILGCEDAEFQSSLPSEVRYLPRDSQNEIEDVLNNQFSQYLSKKNHMGKVDYYKL